MDGIILVSQVRQKGRSISILFVLFMQREVQVESEEEAGLLYKRESPHRMRFQPLCEKQSRSVKIGRDSNVWGERQFTEARSSLKVNMAVLTLFVYIKTYQASKIHAPLLRALGLF
jgi:hypothetical protein